jgi:micrococcal nuclease
MRYTTQVALATLAAFFAGMIYGAATTPASYASSNTPDPARSTTATLTRTVDGDTIIARTAGRDVTVRLLGIDTPETVDPRKPVQPYGSDASCFTRDFLAGSTLTLESDPWNAGPDKYGRALNYVYRGRDGAMLNVAITRAGLAHSYLHWPITRAQQILDAENEAHAARRGLWSLDASTSSTTSTTPTTSTTSQRQRPRSVSWLYRHPSQKPK